MIICVFCCALPTDDSKRCRVSTKLLGHIDINFLVVQLKLSSTYFRANNPGMHFVTSFIVTILLVIQTALFTKYGNKNLSLQWCIY